MPKYPSPRPGRMWTFRRRVAAYIRFFGNWVDQGDGLWIDDFFTQKQNERYEELRIRFNKLRQCIQDAMASSEPLDSDSLPMAPMKNWSPDPEAEPEGEPWAVLCVYLNEALADYPEIPEPVVKPYSGEDLRQRALDRFGKQGQSV